MSEFESGDNEKYELEAIQDSAVYVKKTGGHLLGLYYLVAWRRYLEEENMWEPSSTVIYLWKMVSIFHKSHLEKPMATSAPLDTTSPIAKPII